MTNAENVQNGNAVFEGIVGTLSEDDIQKKDYVRRKFPLRKRPTHMVVLGLFRSWQLPLGLLPVTVSVIVIYLLSRFEAKSSTYTQRLFTTTWLELGYLGIPAWQNVLVENKSKRQVYSTYRKNSLSLLLITVPSVGGFVVVAQMLNEYGICRRV